MDQERAVPKSLGLRFPHYDVYGVCGSQNYHRFGHRAMDVKTGNAGPKLHRLVWEKSGFPARPCERYF